MFGYVVIDKPNILIKDYQTYRSYYCGLCKTIGKHCNQIMRFTLNYDIVYLALLGYNYERKEPVFKKGRCPVHLLKKIEYVDNTEINERIADINSILGYYKVVDDVQDENKRRIFKSIIKPAYKKSAKRMPSLDVKIKAGYERIRRHEKENADLTTLSEDFGYLLMDVADALTDKCDANLRQMLFYIGTWVYCIDAVDDIKKDFEKQNFNPFLRNVKCLDDKFYDEVENKARILLYRAIEQVTECYNKMEIDISEGALSNIVYRGLKMRTENILKKRGKECPKIRL